MKTKKMKNTLGAPSNKITRSEMGLSLENSKTKEPKTGLGGRSRSDSIMGLSREDRQQLRAAEDTHDSFGER